ncbi:hypothetical protein [Streptomyces lanatus]|uniref:WD40 repeat domain-containing protein n=1 Tax=Streptomyces lanatus TaxID=66900 RepID=A0ABV1Y684_9ACTN|nr:hypothetical protein [Streptomyces lanatus]GHH29619.1 hypothetical protein GCM10018780_87930 [Streptomyces lanatus]
MGKRDASDEAYVVDLCDQVLGETALAQHKFDWLLGDTGASGQRAKLPVDAYWPGHQLVVEYRILRHAAQHAVSAGRLDELLQDGGYLQHADLHTLADALRYAHSEQARLNAAVYRASWSIHHPLPPAARRQLLALDAARFRNTRLQAELPGDTDWQVRWATGSQVSTALVRALTGHTGEVRAVAVTEMDGRPHAITGGDDGVWVWDLTTGTQTHELTGHTGEVEAVAMAELDARPHAITGGDDGVRVWDLTTGTCLTTFHCPASVTALAVTAAATVVVSFGREVAVLDLAPLKGRLR